VVSISKLAAEPQRPQIANVLHHYKILQQLNGACYMTSLDLSSAYLQIELHEDSGKYTGFLFASTVYQYKRVPYGFLSGIHSERTCFWRAREIGCYLEDYRARVGAWAARLPRRASVGHVGARGGKTDMGTMILCAAVIATVLLSEEWS
jgi:hypothetical protein